MATYYLDTEHGYIINRAYLWTIFEAMTAEEQQEYNNNGTLKPLTAEEYNNMWNNYC